jgi:ketosteroid isomerase-like protein
VPQVKRLKAVRKYSEEIYPFIVSLKDVIERIEIANASDLAYNISPYKGILKTLEGTSELQGKFLIVWKKMNNEWNCVACSWGSNNPR